MSREFTDFNFVHFFMLKWAYLMLSHQMKLMPIRPPSSIFRSAIVRFFGPGSTEAGGLWPHFGGIRLFGGLGVDGGVLSKFSPFKSLIPVISLAAEDS